MTDFEILIQKPNMECETLILKNGRIEVGRCIVFWFPNTDLCNCFNAGISCTSCETQVKFYITILFA